MKIAFLTREYPPDSAWGGIATVYHNLARALTDRGHEIHVICQAVGKPRDYAENGVFVYRVGTNPKRYSAIARTNYSFHAWGKLNEVIRKNNIAVIDASLMGAEGLFCSLFSKPSLVVNAQTASRTVLQTKSYQGVTNLPSFKLLSVLEEFTARRAIRVVANSQALYSRLVNEANIPSNKIDIVHYAIDTTKFKFVGSDIRQKLGIPDKAPVVLCVGRLEMRKGSHIMCEAIPHIVESMPDTKFVFLGRDSLTAGNGESFKRYIIDKAQRKNFFNNLIFIDFLSEDDLIELYSACDVFVSASLQESFGLPIIEAMACGKPVVTTPVGIVPELQPYALKGLTTAPVGDYKGLAEAAIKYLKLGDSDIRSIAKENRSLIEEEFCIAGWADKMLEIYERAMRRV